MGLPDSEQMVRANSSRRFPMAVAIWLNPLAFLYPDNVFIVEKAEQERSTASAISFVPA